MFRPLASEAKARSATQSAADHGRVQRDRVHQQPIASVGNQTLLRSLAKGPALTALRPSRGGVIQRQCACGGAGGVAGTCDACRADDERKLQRQPADQAGAESAPPIVERVLRSPGQPIDSATRAAMEPHFGVNFDAVRLHTGEEAAQSARAVEAHAYTVGRDIVFARGRYAPDTRTGRQLLAHELTHVVQQNFAANSGGTLTLGDPHDDAEREADAFAAATPAPTPYEPEEP